MDDAAPDPGAPAASNNEAADGSASRKRGAPGEDYQRAYKACINCRNRKAKCILSSDENGHLVPPCKRCQREMRECVFRAERSWKRAKSSPEPNAPVPAPVYTSNIRHGRALRFVDNYRRIECLLTCHSAKNRSQGHPRLPMLSIRPHPRSMCGHVDNLPLSSLEVLPIR